MLPGWDRLNLRPSPKPLEADDVALITGGTVVWTVAFLVCLIFFRDELADAGHSWWMGTCLAGAGLGLIGITYSRRRRAAIARDAAAAQAAKDATRDETGPEDETGRQKRSDDSA